MEKKEGRLPLCRFTMASYKEDVPAFPIQDRINVTIYMGHLYNAPAQYISEHIFTRELYIIYEGASGNYSTGMRI